MSLWAVVCLLKEEYGLVSQPGMCVCVCVWICFDLTSEGHLLRV